MCGLLGFIGSSNDPVKTKELTTALFDITQERGVDAAGYYCVSEFGQNKIYYHKQPGPSSKLIYEKNYLDIWNNNLNLGIFHCRAASVGVGLPSDNINNHPFISTDLKKAVIHNGIISRDEYNYLKNIYQTESSCDSEIILRVLEQHDSPIVDNLSFLLSHTINSQFAIAYSQIEKNNRSLFLFRNKHRPLFMANLIDQIGQIFFFSTLDIFFEALEKIKTKKIFINCDNLLEIKPYEIHEIIYNKSNEIEMNIFESVFTDENCNMKDKFYNISSANDITFNIEKNSVQKSKQDVVFESVALLAKNQKELENNILNLLQKKEQDNASYEKTINEIKELNDKINYLNNNIKGKI